jgi:hypothetical protein
MMNRYARHAGLTVVLVLYATGAWADKTTTIWFVQNTDPKNPAECVASTVTKKQFVKRNEPVKWWLKSDPDNSCPHFNPQNVYLLFSTDVVGKNHKVPGKGNASNGHADAKTTADTTVAPDDSVHSYKVYYADKIAEDPELDVKGDMPPLIKGARGRGAAPKPKQ